MDIKHITPPLAGNFLFSVAVSMIFTILVVSMNEAHASILQISALSSVFSIGVAIGAFKLGRVVKRVGHIRAFTSFTAIMISTYLLHGIFVIPSLWIALRFFNGIAFGGCLLVVESWLISAGKHGNRGQILGIYMVTIYSANSIGQLLIELWDLNTMHAFSVAAIISAMSIIPLALANTEQPSVAKTNILSWKLLFQMAKIGLVSAFVAGTMVISIFGLLPYFFLKQSDLIVNDIGIYMAITIFGGVILQYPIGKLSDKFNRPMLIVVNSALIIAASVTVVNAFHVHWLAMICLFFFGGLTFSLYPLSVSHVCDKLTDDLFVPGSQSMLLLYSIGAAAGPLLGGVFIEAYGANGLFYFVISMMSALIIFITIFSLIQQKLVKPKEPYIAMPSGTTPIVSKIDPRHE